MAVYLSPGVFPREIDLSALPTAAGPLRPAFIGAAKKGPMNQAVFISSSTQYIDIFGEPFAESYLGYAVLSYMEEGNQCYVMRVGVACQNGQPTELDDVCVDVSGSRIKGWGRVPLFTGIDYGRINLRPVTASDPVVFHAASVTGIEYNDVMLSSTDGPTTATVVATGTYNNSIHDSVVLIITGAPTGSSPVAGATYEAVLNSDGSVLKSGTFTDPASDGVSNVIALGNGVNVKVVVTGGHLDVNDTFLFNLVPNNLTFTISVEGDAGVAVSASGTYTSAASLVAALNSAATTAYQTATVDLNFVFVVATLDDGTLVPQIRTLSRGDRVQVMGTAGWATELGIEQYGWDIPRSYLLGLDQGPYSITSQNNRVVMDVIGAAGTKRISFNVPVGLNQTPTSVAASIEAASVISGQKYFDSFALTIPGGSTHVCISATPVATLVDHSLDTLVIKADYSNIKSLKFCDTVAIQYPYKRSYRGYSDGRVALPAGGEADPAVPASCSDVNSAACVADTAYYESVVGWFVATSAGTWASEFNVSLEQATALVGDPSGRYNLTIKNSGNAVLDYIQDVSFDATKPRYVGNVLNPGSPFGGLAGNAYINWEPRPSYLQFDPNVSDYTVRLPSPFSNKSLIGMANGVPLDPAYSSELDAAVIGNPAESTGLYAFQNPEAIDINILCTPGFSSGAVIGQALAMCEARGDVLYLVDPPFGLRPQQAVDWHNGMLLSDLRSAINSSYGALYWGWLQIFDQFSSNYLWVPPSGHVAAIFSRTARVAEQWFAPAGLRRGRVLSAVNVEYSPSTGERDMLYGSGNAVNPLVKFPQDGIVVWGQRTLQREDTALSRVSVRMLLIYIKKSLTRTLRSYIFEPNDQVLWAQVTSAIDPFLADIAARRGLTGYKIICDASNNTPDRMDRGELWVSVFLRPTRAVEFVALNLVVMRTGASFSAEDVLAAAGATG